MKTCPYNEVINHYQRFYLTWIINNICTNQCRYCPKYLHAGKNHHYDWREAEYFIDTLLEEHKYIHLVVSGGEPTVSPFLPDLLKKFAGHRHYAGVSSNGVRRADYWDGLDVENLGLSYHAAFHDDQWIERAVEASKYVKQVTLNLMMDPLYWDHCVIMYDRMLQETGLSVIPTMIVDWGPGSEKVTYTKDQEQWFIDNPAVYRDLWIDPLMPGKYKGDPTLFDILDSNGRSAFNPPETTTRETFKNWPIELINRRENNFALWECDIGLKSTFVQFDGSYRRGNCEQGGYAGWIRDGFKPFENSVICGYTECQCLTDISVPKRKQNKPMWMLKRV